MLAQPVRARQPLDLVRLEEAQAPVLPLLFLGGAPKTYCQWLIHLCNLFEPANIQAPYRRARDLENFAQGSVTRECGPRALRDQLAPLQPNDRVDLLLGELLHGINDLLMA